MPNGKIGKTNTYIHMYIHVHITLPIFINCNLKPAFFLTYKLPKKLSNETLLNTRRPTYTI